jgi:hypothetical protein
VKAHALDAGERLRTAAGARAVACVALPTCGLAMAEAERYLPDFTARLQPLLEKHGLRDAPILLRISGCPNGCSRPYLGEIALVGKAPGRYNLMLGADHRGQRLNTLYRENIDEAAILDTLDGCSRATPANAKPAKASATSCTAAAWSPCRRTPPIDRSHRTFTHEPPDPDSAADIAADRWRAQPPGWKRRRPSSASPGRSSTAGRTRCRPASARRPRCAAHAHPGRSRTSR